MLCNLKRKSQIRDEVYRIRKQLEDARAKDIPDPRITVNAKKIKAEDDEVQRQVDVLLHELSELENKPDRKIAVCDVMEMTKQLHQPLAKKEAQEIIWEVCSAMSLLPHLVKVNNAVLFSQIDDDLDQCIDWPEFRLMFTRNITDKSGLEPSKMFFLTQFLIYDHNENGKVSVDETMNMLYARLVFFSRYEVIFFIFCLFYRLGTGALKWKRSFASYSVKTCTRQAEKAEKSHTRNFCVP